MGGRVGYEYRFRFSMVDEHEINSLHKLDVIYGLKLKLLLFEIRTNFILKRRRRRPEEEEEEEEEVIIDSEKFDAFSYAHGDDEQKDASMLAYSTEYRLREYWMSEDEISSLVNVAVSFANDMAAKPENASLDIIPTVVHLEVRTVQQEGESSDAAMDRAIRADCLVPLYLWPRATTVERKLTPMIRCFLRELDRIRVEDVDEGLALMQVCHICSRKPNVGAQISSLPCGRAFLHSHCIIRWWEDNDLCPLCPCSLLHHVIMSEP